MPKQFRITPRQRIFNAILIRLINAGIPTGPFYLLTVQGRKTGKCYHLPVTPIERDGKCWLVSPYGTVSWVRNARAAGTVTLTRGRTSEILGIVEQSPVDSAPILKEYLGRFLYVRRGGYFDVTAESPLEEFVAEAPYHPVFQLVERYPKQPDGHAEREKLDQAVWKDPHLSASTSTQSHSQRKKIMSNKPKRPLGRRIQARLMGMLNIFMRPVLRLPVETPLTKRLMLVSFTGRKTGKAYQQPLSYVQQGDTLLTPGGGKWKLNLREDQPVRIRLRGHDVFARPEFVKDPDEIERLIGAMTAANPTVGYFVGIPKGTDGRLDRGRLETAVKYGFMIVRWHLGEERAI
jgi:deazaflavin-dependent oxidoreductase (nitroreductase family)